jgi:hypothetical protein
MAKMVTRTRLNVTYYVRLVLLKYSDSTRTSDPPTVLDAEVKRQTTLAAQPDSTVQYSTVPLNTTARQFDQLLTLQTNFPEIQSICPTSSLFLRHTNWPCRVCVCVCVCVSAPTVSLSSNTRSWQSCSTFGINIVPLKDISTRFCICFLQLGPRIFKLQRNKTNEMHIQRKVNHIFRISMLLLHVSALYERHLQGAQRILMKLCVFYLCTYDVAYAQFHQDPLGSLKMAFIQRRNM